MKTKSLSVKVYIMNLLANSMIKEDPGVKPKKKAT